MPRSHLPTAPAPSRQGWSTNRAVPGAAPASLGTSCCQQRHSYGDTPRVLAPGEAAGTRADTAAPAHAAAPGGHGPPAVPPLPSPPLPAAPHSPAGMAAGLDGSARPGSARLGSVPPQQDVPAGCRGRSRSGQKCSATPALSLCVFQQSHSSHSQD